MRAFFATTAVATSPHLQLCRLCRCRHHHHHHDHHHPSPIIHHHHHYHYHPSSHSCQVLLHKAIKTVRVNPAPVSYWGDDEMMMQVNRNAPVFLIFCFDSIPFIENSPCSHQREPSFTSSI